MGGLGQQTDGGNAQAFLFQASLEMSELIFESPGHQLVYVRVNACLHGFHQESSHYRKRFRCRCFFMLDFCSTNGKPAEHPESAEEQKRQGALFGTEPFQPEYGTLYER